MTADEELTTLLREGMRREAYSVAADRALADRIVTAAEAAQPPARTARSADPGWRPAWRRWLGPVAAAVAVAALVLSVVLGSAVLRGQHPQPGRSSTPPASPGPSATPSPSGSSVRPSPSSSATGSGSATAGAPGPAGGPVPRGFRAVSLSWVSVDEGWALGTAPCSHAPCTSLVRTRDGGRSWVGLPAPVAELSGTAQCSSAGCVSDIRFADPLVGYAYGPSAMWLTVDGGAHWQPGSGGADALEIANGTVLRVVSGLGCPPGCTYRLQRAAVGTLAWQDVPLPAGTRPGVGVRLARSGPAVAVLFTANPAGGANNATSVLYTSDDNGATWTARGEPCPQNGDPTVTREVDSTAVTLAPDRSLTLLCVPRGGRGSAVTLTSTDGGVHFTAGSPAGTFGSVLGAASSEVLFASTDVLRRSTDGGRSWSVVAGGAGPTAATFIGFESATVGRVIDAGSATGATVGAATVWTTTDAGAHWRRYDFPS